MVDVGVCKHPCPNLPCWQGTLTPICLPQKRCACSRLSSRNTWNLWNTHTHTPKLLKEWKQCPGHWAAVGVGRTFPQMVSSSFRRFTQRNYSISIHQGNTMQATQASINRDIPKFMLAGPWRWEVKPRPREAPGLWGKNPEKGSFNKILSTETLQWAMTEQQNMAVLQQLQNPALRTDTARCPRSCGFPACCLDKIN